MASDENQVSAFNFLVDHLASMAPFSPDDLAKVTTWSKTTFKTYWSKQYKPFVILRGDGQYRVSEAFRPYTTWEKFQQHVTQVRRLASSDYKHSEYSFVRVYEFFMPLTNEGHLRSALDALFYRDRVAARLQTVPDEDLRAAFPPNEDEEPGAYVDRICDWISDRFGGYSIYHVNGRFRAAKLSTRDQAAKMPRYLVDETTAVTRFIFPCKDEAEAKLVEFFFHYLFVQAVVEVVNAEDEIWMTETGMQNKLHTWRVGKG